MSVLDMKVKLDDGTFKEVISQQGGALNDCFLYKPYEQNIPGQTSVRKEVKLLAVDLFTLKVSPYECKPSDIDKIEELSLDF